MCSFKTPYEINKEREREAFIQQEAMEIQLESSSSSSPEFQFWSAHPPLKPNILTADELFVDGVLLPLHSLSVTVTESKQPPPPNLESQKSILKSKEEVALVSPATVASIPPEASICSPSITSSKRWKDIFKVGGGEKKKESSEEKKKEKKSSNSGGNVGGVAELNINIWPFSRSRSAGTASGVRPKATTAAAMRKSSSAPCSRSNSRGENGRRWAASPGRPGVHVGRASPVWQARRGAGVGRAGPGRDKGRKGLGLNGGGGARGLTLNVNSCIGYRNQGSCRGEEGERVNNCNNGGLFRFRALFSKKVY